MEIRVWIKMMPEYELEDNNPLHEYLKKTPMISNSKNSKATKQITKVNSTIKSLSINNDDGMSIMTMSENTTSDKQILSTSKIESISDGKECTESINHSIDGSDKVKQMKKKKFLEYKHRKYNKYTKYID